MLIVELGMQSNLIILASKKTRAQFDKAFGTIVPSDNKFVEEPEEDVEEGNLINFFTSHLIVIWSHH